MEVIQEFEMHGFELASVQAAGVRSIEKALKQKHLVKLNRTEKMFNGEIQPQVAIFNSYDGTAALNIHIAVFRFICQNGIISGTYDYEPLRILHSNKSWQSLVHEYIDGYAEKLESQKESILQMKDTSVTLDEAYAYAKDAYTLRHSDARISNDLQDPLELLITRRKEDRGQSAWNVFNRVQEALSQGYFHKYDVDGSLRKAKILTNIDEIVRMNKDLSTFTHERLIA